MADHVPHLGDHFLRLQRLAEKPAVGGDIERCSVGHHAARAPDPEFALLGEILIDFEFLEAPGIRCYVPRSLLDQVLDMYTPPTQQGEAATTLGFGQALAGRGGGLNRAIGAFVPLVDRLAPVMRNLAAPRPGLKGFITAHKEMVTIFINDAPYRIERGERTVAEILAKVGQTPEGYVLLEEKKGPPMPLPPDRPVIMVSVTRNSTNATTTTMPTSR